VHHTSFSFDVTVEQLQDFAEMADIELLIIDENTRTQISKEPVGMKFPYPARGVSLGH
jgi:L-arabinose isomerase